MDNMLATPRITAATRERPKVYLDPVTGELQWLFTGTVGGLGSTYLQASYTCHEHTPAHFFVLFLWVFLHYKRKE